MPIVSDTVPAGGKAAGLRALHEAWVPRFFTIVENVYDRWRNAGSATSLENLVDGDEIHELESALSRLGVPPAATSVYVRSNATSETLEARGRFKSARADGTVEGVLQAAEAVFKSTLGEPRALQF